MLTEEARIVGLGARLASVHRAHEGRVVGALAHRRQLLLAVAALATRDLEGDDDALQNRKMSLGCLCE